MMRPTMSSTDMSVRNCFLRTLVPLANDWVLDCTHGGLSERSFSKTAGLPLQAGTGACECCAWGVMGPWALGVARYRNQGALDWARMNPTAQSLM